MSKRKHVIELARSIPVNEEQWMQKFVMKLCAMEPTLPTVFLNAIKERQNDAEERTTGLRPRV
jgi:hypothetical protein